MWDIKIEKAIIICRRRLKDSWLAFILRTKTCLNVILYSPSTVYPLLFAIAIKSIFKITLYYKTYTGDKLRMR